MPSEKFPRGIPHPPESGLQEIKLPFRRFRLCLRPDMIGRIIKKNALLLDAANTGVRSQFRAQSSI